MTSSLRPAPGPSTTGERDRKAEHIALALEPRMQVSRSAFDSWVFEHCALPELDFDQIDTSCSFLGKRLEAPLLISCMTGGTGEAAHINRNLAAAAERRGVAVGVGSQRKALEDPSVAETFAVREHASSVPILANLGAVQLNYGYGPSECQQAVDMIQADALVLHLNPLQEALQPEGDLNFSSLLPRIAEVVEKISVPVIAKEVGSGLSTTVGRQLANVGVTVLDCAGMGGTSWARIEAARAETHDLGELFADWGIQTPENLRQLADVPGVELIGSGGVRHGLDVAKAVALGATLAGMAYPFLEPAIRSADAVVSRIDETFQELRIAMFCTGSRNLTALRRARIERRTHP